MGISFFGFSHLDCLEAAYDPEAPGAPECNFVFLKDEEFGWVRGSGRLDTFEVERIRSAVAACDKDDLLVLSIRGNEHIASAMLDLDLPQQTIHSRIEKKVREVTFPWLDMFAAFGYRALVVPPPPPMPAAHIIANPRRFRQRIDESGIAPPPVRIAAWKHQTELMRQKAKELGMEFLDMPAEVFSPEGLLRVELAANDPAHGNARLGAILLERIFAIAGPMKPAAARQVPLPPAAKEASQRGHPYKGLPDRAFWRESVAAVPAATLDPVHKPPFQIARTDKVATAGSCFAQHISKHLRKGGFQFLVTEQPATGEGSAEQRGFYDFSARYGNLYTSRQLVQLFDRAYGKFKPAEEHWALEGGRVCDPFRPRIEPDGFTSLQELRQDRARHLKAVRDMFEQLDVFVFTLGLTECWISKQDGAAFPLAPGVAGGRFDPSRHAFVNLGAEEITADLRVFIEKLRGVNPKARVILTVSPVPLAATYEDEHVLVSTTYSKSVLRVAAETIRRSHEGVYYFPSYEIITGAYARGKYFAADLRSVTEEGVSHVMQVFMQRMAGAGTGAVAASDQADDAKMDEMEALADANCDEILLARRR